MITHLSHALSTLVAPDGDKPIPSRDGISTFIGRLCESYFAKHSGHDDPLIRLLTFGYEGIKPWASTISWEKASGLQRKEEWINSDTFLTIGQDALFRKRANDLRDKVIKHRKLVAERDSTGNNHASAVEIERHNTAERKLTEGAAIQSIEDNFVSSIGGVLQRLELAKGGYAVEAGFTQDDRPYFNLNNFSLAPDGKLGSIPIVQKMGRS